MRKLLTLWLFLFSLCPLWAEGELDLIKQRITQHMLETPRDEAQAKEVLATQQEDGTWPDVNYQDTSLTGFQHRKHLERTQNMALCYAAKEATLYKDKKLLQGINRSLAHWCQKDYVAADWWYNIIFIPITFETIAFALEKDIAPAYLDKMKEIISRSKLSSPWARPSADRIKICDISAKYHILIGDDAGFKQLMNVILSEIKFATGNRGLQSDYSFHHRVHRENNTTTYGLSYGLNCAQWGRFVEGTSYELPQDKKELIVDFWLDGIAKMRTFGCYDEKGLSQREITRYLAPGRADGTPFTYLLHFTDYRQDEIKEIIALSQGKQKKTTLSYFKYFNQSDCVCYQRPGFYASVRMYSRRNRNHELAHSSEALKSHHKADGANHVYTVGDEYDNIWPMFDWQRIPGATIAKKAQMPSEHVLQRDGFTTFVGAATDGLYGVIGYDFISSHDFTHAKKSWFFFEHEYVCLGAGISANRFAEPIITSINQCRLQGKVHVADGSSLKPEEQRVINSQDVKWVQHHGLAYIFLAPQQVTISNKSQSGTWYSINSNIYSSKEVESAPIFSLWMDHGIAPQGKDTYSYRPGIMGAKDVTYSYMIAPCADGAKVDTDRGIELLSNTHLLQAVRNNKLKITQAVFYEAGRLELGREAYLEAYTPIIIMMKQRSDKSVQITASDPTQRFKRAYLHLGGYGDVMLELPQGDFAGNSVSITLEYP